MNTRILTEVWCVDRVEQENAEKMGLKLEEDDPSISSWLPYAFDLADVMTIKETGDSGFAKPGENSTITFRNDHENCVTVRIPFVDLSKRWIALGNNEAIEEVAAANVSHNPLRYGLGGVDLEVVVRGQVSMGLDPYKLTDANDQVRVHEIVRKIAEEREKNGSNGNQNTTGDGMTRDEDLHWAIKIRRLLLIGAGGSMDVHKVEEIGRHNTILRSITADMETIYGREGLVRGIGHSKMDAFIKDINKYFNMYIAQPRV